MKNAFQKVGRFWFLLAAGISLALAAGWGISLRNTIETVEWVEHTNKVLYALRTVSVLIDEAVVGVRGYDVTGEDRFLESYDRSLSAVDAELGAIRKLTADNLSQQKRLTVLETLVAERRNRIKETLDEKRRGRNDAFAQLYLGEYGEKSRQRIREAITEMEDDERRLLDLRKQAITSNRHWSSAVFLAGTTVNLAFLGLLFRTGREIGRQSVREQSLRHSQERFQGIFDDATFGIALVDPDWKWLEVNRSLCVILGYSREELLGSDAQRLTHPDDLEADVAQARRVLDGEISSYRMEKRYIHKRGQVLWIALSVSLVRDDAGRPLHIVKLMEDITPRRRAAEVLAERTQELEATQARLSVTAEFVSTLNQEGMLDVYQGALGCLARATEVPLAVIYGGSNGDNPVPQCAVGADHQPLSAAPFAGDGLPATVVRTSEVQTLFGPFEATELRIHFGLGEVGLHSVVGWPIVYMGRCLGALVTAHTAPLTVERGAFITASLAQLAIRMNGFQVEQQRLQLVADLEARSSDLQAQTERPRRGQAGGGAGQSRQE